MRSILYRFQLLTILMVLAAPLSAQDLILTGPEPAQVSLGSQAGIRLEWNVQGQKEVRLLAPPKVPGLPMQVRSPSRNEFSTNINGRVSRRVTLIWTVILSPQKKGVFEIPPFKVRFGNQIKRSKPSQLRVVENLAAKDACFLEAKIQKSKLYKGQKLEALLTIWIDESIMNRLIDGHIDQHEVGVIVRAPWMATFPAGIILKPTARSDDFNVVQIDLSQRIPARFIGSKDRGERSYRVFRVVRSFRLNREGSFKLEPVTIQVRFVTGYRRNLFNQIEPASIANGFAKTGTLSFEVLPLPKEGRPDNFTGAVGKYQLSGSLSKTSLAVGESTSLSLRLEGEGDFEFVDMPELDDIPGFHRYSRKVQHFPDHVLATYEISPVDASLEALPAVDFAYFDPEEGNYKRSRMAMIPIRVRKPNNAVELPSLPEEGGKLVEGLDDIFDRLPLDGALPADWRPASIMVFGAGAVPFAFLLFWFLFWIPFQRSKGDTLGRRKRAAQARFLQHLESEGALPAFSLYLAERLGWQAGEAANTDLAERLAEAGVSQDLTLRTTTLMANLEALRYGGEGQDATLADEARCLIEELERGTTV